MKDLQKKRTDEILEKFDRRHEALIGILQAIQKEEHYLPREVLEYISQNMEVPLSRIFTIASFYKSFSLEPRGRHTIRVCLGTACHLNGAVQNLEQIERTINIDPGETSDDLMFSLETVNCLGTCALAPVTVVDDTYYDAVTPGQVKRILTAYVKESADNEDG